MFSPLGTKLKEITSHDVINIDLCDTVHKLSIPALFFVTDEDTVSGTRDVEELFEKYGSNSLLQGHKKGLVKGKGHHNSERTPHDLHKCIEFLLENYRMRVDQGLHDDTKEMAETFIEDKSDLHYDRDLDDDSKPLSEMILDSQREVTCKKIQIAPHVSLFSSLAKTEEHEPQTNKVAFEDLDDSMMEFSQQVEDLMTKQTNINPKLKPTSYATCKSGMKSPDFIQSPTTLHPRDTQDSGLNSLIIHTPFAIQTKGSKK